MKILPWCRNKHFNLHNDMALRAFPPYLWYLCITTYWWLKCLIRKFVDVLNPRPPTGGIGGMSKNGLLIVCESFTTALNSSPEFKLSERKAPIFEDRNLVFCGELGCVAIFIFRKGNLLCCDEKFFFGSFNDINSFVAKRSSLTGSLILVWSLRNSVGLAAVWELLLTSGSAPGLCTTGWRAVWTVFIWRSESFVVALSLPRQHLTGGNFTSLGHCFVRFACGRSFCLCLMIQLPLVAEILQWYPVFHSWCDPLELVTDWL